MLKNDCKGKERWLQSKTAKLILGIILLLGIAFSAGYRAMGSLDPKDDQWYITEYSDHSGNQAMF